MSYEEKNYCQFTTALNTGRLCSGNYYTHLFNIHVSNRMKCMIKYCTKFHDVFDTVFPNEYKYCPDEVHNTKCNTLKIDETVVHKTIDTGRPTVFHTGVTMGLAMYDTDSERYNRL